MMPTAGSRVNFAYVASMSAYNALTPNSNTVYFVGTGTNTFSLILGDHIVLTPASLTQSGLMTTEQVARLQASTYVTGVSTSDGSLISIDTAFTYNGSDYTLTLWDGTGALIADPTVDSSGIVFKYRKKSNSGTFSIDTVTLPWSSIISGLGLGALAFKDTASASYTPKGSVTTPTFSGNVVTSTGTFIPEGSVSVSISSSDSVYAEIVEDIDSSEVTYTPSGTVSQPTFLGSQSQVSVSGTPAGTISQPVVTVTPNTTTINSITDVGELPSCTLPSMSASVANEVLTLGWLAGNFNAGSLPTVSADTTVVTGIQSASATAPTFTGQAMTSVGDFTPTGTVSQPSFTGSGARLVSEAIAIPKVLSGSFSGDEGSISVSGTSSGTVSQPTFTGTTETITVS